MAPHPGSMCPRRAYARYPTPPDVAARLVAMLDMPRPSAVLDLACGDGALLTAARERWPGLRATTLDIDPAVAPPPGGKRTHVVGDMLDPGLPDVLVGFDLVLCNPPYVPVPWTEGSAAILAGAGLLGPGVRRAACSAVLGLARSIELTRPGGTVAMVLPDAIATGERSAGLRRALLETHGLRRIEQLPAYTFGATEARAMLLVAVRDGGPTASFDYRDASGRGATLDGAVERFEAPAPPAAGRTLADLGAEVRRGSLHPAAARSLGVPSFGYVDFPHTGHPVRLPIPVACPTPSPVSAEPGDILVARLGRNGHARVCYVETGRAVLTDAVLRVRVSPDHRAAVLAALASPDGGRRLAAAARGTTARVLPACRLMTMPLPI